MAKLQTPFWRNVVAERERLAVALQKRQHPGQPVWDDANIAYDESINAYFDNNPVYITSLRHNDRGTRPGFTVMTTVYLGAQRLTEQTHQISTKDQIDEYTRGLLRERHEIEKRSAGNVVKDFAQTLASLTVPATLGPDGPAEQIAKQEEQQTRGKGRDDEKRKD